MLSFLAVVTLAIAVMLVICYLQLNKTEEKLRRAKSDFAKFENDTIKNIAQIHEGFEGERQAKAAAYEANIARLKSAYSEQLEKYKRHVDVIREQYENHSKDAQNKSIGEIRALLERVETLRQYELVNELETDAKNRVQVAISEAEVLKAEATKLFEETKKLAQELKENALLEVQDIHDQANERLQQAVLQSAAIVKKADKHAEEIAGDAIIALRDRDALEGAIRALVNKIEGYGDKYLLPNHSLLDDLARDYGYHAAGQSLAAAQSRRIKLMEEGLAATCDYSEINRRDTAIRFVLYAFNGSVDAILTRIKNTNAGTLQQEIIDSYNLINVKGTAFRNARILPVYLEAVLDKLKYGVQVYEVAQRDKEEQRFLREQERDRQKAEQARMKELEQAEKEKKLISEALAVAEAKFKLASEQEKAALNLEIGRLQMELVDVNAKELTIAQRTIKGRIYIISNIGSFGEQVFKIGLTRRDAEERVDELNSASVPFEFDIHAVINSDDAPDLEHSIHQELLSKRMNKMNLRKEFFRVSLSEIMDVVSKVRARREEPGEVIWTEKSRAQQYFETAAIENDLERTKEWLEESTERANKRERYRAAIRASAPPLLVNSEEILPAP